MADIDQVYTKTSRSTKSFRYDKIEIGPEYWFIHKYYLTVRLAWETFTFHVGDIEVDPTQSLKIEIQIPLK